MSIKVRVEVSIGGSSQLSFDRLGVLVDVCREESADEWMLLSIDVDLFSLRIVCSKSAESVKNNDFSLLLLLLLGMHLKEVKEKNLSVFE